MIETTRRGFLNALGLAIAAPAIVRVASIMPVKAMPADDVLNLMVQDFNEGLFGELTTLQKRRWAAMVWKTGRENFYIPPLDPPS